MNLDAIQKLYDDFIKIRFSARPTIKMAKAVRQGYRHALLLNIPGLIEEIRFLRLETKCQEARIESLEAQLAQAEDTVAQMRFEN